MPGTSAVPGHTEFHGIVQKAVLKKPKGALRHGGTCPEPPFPLEAGRRRIMKERSVATKHTPLFCGLLEMGLRQHEQFLVHSSS